MISQDAINLLRWALSGRSVGGRVAGFPRLVELFGVDVGSLDAAAIKRAVAAQVAENEQLDWKQEPYASGKGDEIAKDIAAFANHLGGVIVIGVAEEDGRASQATPFTTPADGVVNQIRQAFLSQIEPFVRVTVTPIPTTDGDTGWFLAIIVPKSPDAPHAVRSGKNDTPRYGFPVREGTGTRWLRESEIAPRYRDRYTARSDIAQQLVTVHDRGVGEFETPNPWLSVACVPLEYGSRPVGPEARAAEAGFLQSWLTYGPPRQLFDSAATQRPLTAIARTIFSDRATRGERSRRVHIELGHDGTGMCGRLLTPVNNVTGPTATDLADRAQWLAADQIEWALFTGVHLLAEHAIDTGTSGDLAFIAQLHRPAGVSGVCVVDTVEPVDSYYGLWASKPLPTTTATTTVALGPVRDNQAVAAGAYLLGTDILAEFGIDQPRAFTIDGAAITAHFGPWATPHVTAWATTHLAT